MAGHFLPLVPLIETFRDNGEQVLLVVPPAAVARAESLRIPVRIGGSPDPAEVARLWGRFRAAGDHEASVIANRQIFGELNTAAMLPFVEQAVDDYEPEIVLHEATEYAGPIAAMRAGIPHAQVAISLAAVEHDSLQLAAPVLDRYGPVFDTLRAAPYLTRFPAAIDPSAYPDTRRYQEPTAVPRPLPDWWNGSSDPLVYVTFGTVTSSVGTGIYQAAAEALADLPVRVLVTTGQPLNLGTTPPNIRVQSWVDQRDALAETSVVVCHGGSGTTLGALDAGVPMVLVPLLADQARNARALESRGVALVIDSDGANAADRASYDRGVVAALRAAVDHILRNESAAASSMATELRARPTASDLLTHLLA